VSAKIPFTGDLPPFIKDLGVKLSDATSTMGIELRRLREMRGLTLREVSAAAEISPAYLLKIEKGGVNDPSPRVLERIARFFGVSYLGLMDQAGYGTSDSESKPQRSGILASALASETLTEEEQKAVTAFLATLRAQSLE
jgi:transcriptional regulator with XRE-family HTH domain